MADLIEDFRAFLAAAPTSWHAALEMGNRLASKDFIPLFMGEKWQLERGKKYFVIKEGSLLAFALPTEIPHEMAILAAHTDSPALKLKPQPFVQKANMVQLGVELYGAPILASWLNRDLGIAGRVVTMSGERIQEQLVFIDDAPLFIPHLAIHLDRGVNEKGLELNKQEHLVPIATLAMNGDASRYLEDLLHRTLAFEKLLSHDLFLVPLEPPRYLGGASEMLASYRLDNLASSFAALIGMGHLEKPTKNKLQVAVFWDHEEVGSQSSVGAESPLFADVYQRITDFYKMSVEDQLILKENASCLSIDNTHALNPNYENKYDPQHKPLLGKGAVVKFNALQRYSSGALGVAKVIQLADRLGLKLQQYVCRSDIPSGTTVGPIFATQLGIETVDIGIAQLSMHAIREVISVQDFAELCTLLTHYLQEK